MAYKAYRQKPKPEPRAGACVYDIVHHGEVVYVGMTKYPKKRFANHRASGIAPDGSKLVVHKWYPTREDAMSEEYSRQIELKPAFCRESYCYGPDGKALQQYITPEGGEGYRVIGIGSQ